MTDSVTLGLSALGPTSNLPFVVILGSDAARRTFPLDGPLVIGSGTTADVSIDDPAVSRRHVRLVPAGGTVVVLDEGSKNGVFIGSTRIFEAAVKAPATIMVGTTPVTIDVARRAPVPRTTKTRSFGRFTTSALHVAGLLSALEKAALTEATILLEGESGTGKELLAEAIHDASPRSAGPMEVLDCAALVPTLIEAELFGAERGAFTGAERARQGAFARARGGTLFLDEIGELPLAMQTRLLGALERRRVRPIGGAAEVDIDVRIIAATNRNLEREVEGGRFRLDLFHRLAVVTARVPPLRERPEDILVLAEHFLTGMGGDPHLLDQDVRASLIARRYPGNARELRNVIERLVVLGDATTVALAADRGGPTESAAAVAAAGLPYAQARELALEQFTAAYVVDMLRRHDGNVTRAAAAAGIARRHFHRLKLVAEGQ
jgi:transcriptional regulator with PAS, ATPase and Fis domain